MKNRSNSCYYTKGVIIMIDKEKISVSFYKIIMSVKDNISLPTHKTIEYTLIYSVVLLFCSVLSTLLRFYTFVSWQGCLMCTVFHVVLLYKERSENDALLRMYRNARVSAEKVVQRAKDTGSRINGRRSSDGANSAKQETRTRKQ